MIDVVIALDEIALQQTAMRGLSGGQKSRVAMAAVSYARPHVLIADEPTNNLDVEAVTALIECLQRFEGGVIVVSHDAHFVGSVGKEFLCLEGGRVRREESFASYLARKRAAVE